MKKGLKGLLILAVCLIYVSLGIGSADCPAEMKAYWKFDEGSGITVSDSVNGNDCTFVDNPVWTSGKINDALNFDGVAPPNNDYVNCGSNADLDDIEQLTVIAWIYPESIGSGCYSRIVGKGQWTFYMQDGCGRSRTLKFAKRFSGGDVFWRTPDNSLNYNEWQFVAVTYDGSDIANEPILYINGNPQPIGVTGNPNGIANSDALSDLTIGSNDVDLFGYGITPFDGIIDEVAIYDHILSQAEIQNLYNSGNGKPYCTSTPSYPSCSDDDRIMKLFQSNNSHGALYNDIDYIYDVCYSDIFGSVYSGDLATVHDCDGTNKVLGLFSDSNSHAEIPSLSNYPVEVCYGDLECVDVTDPDPCPIDYEIVVRLFQNTNSHISNASDTNYGIKICCKSAAAITPITGVYWANMLGEMINQADLNDLVKLTVSGEFEGKNVEYEIWKEVAWWFDSKVAQTNSEGFTTWRAGLRDDGSLEEGDYYFKARIEGGAWISTEDNEEPYRYLTVTAPEDNSPPSAIIVKPVIDSKNKTNMAIDFEQISEDEDDDLLVEWNFGDGTTKTCIKTVEDCNTTHSYTNWGTKIISLTAREIERGQVDVEQSRIFIYDEGTNVFSLITQPPFGKIFAAGARFIDFDASESYVSECTTSACSPPHGELCYDVEDLHCYDLDKTFIPDEYNLWFNWTFSEPGDDGGRRYGNWSDNYNEVVEFQRAFLEPKTQWARLNVGYEPIS